MSYIRKNLPWIVLLIFFSFIFFFRLDFVPLADWDEAWYGSIAREITRTNDWFRLSWNGYPYFDHPPFGFWLIAVSYKIFGISEFSTRFFSAFLGLISIILIYKIGGLLLNQKIIGFAAALILGSSVWYVVRVRSGNLDSFFVFFYLLTIYFALKSAKNFHWFPLVGLSAGFLIMTKTLIGASFLILVIFLNYRHLIRPKGKLTSLFLAVILFSGIVLPWYLFQLKNFPGFFQRHFIETGMRSKSLTSFFNIYFEKPFYYLHMGIRKWYYIWIAGLIYLFFSLKFLRKPIIFLFLWFIIICYPFLTSEKTELWHLIPLYLPISLIIAIGVYEFLSLFPYRFIFYLAFLLIIFVVQIKAIWFEVIPKSRYTTDEIDISKKVAKYIDKTVVLDEEFLPVSVFYSGRNIIQIVYYPGISNHSIVDLFQSKDKNLIVITRHSGVEKLAKAGLTYKTLEKNNSFLILSK